MPTSKDFTIHQGTTFRQPLVWKTGSSLTPVDLTGATARLQVRSKVASEDVLLSLSTEDTGIVLGGSAGTIDLFLSDTDTSALTWEYGVYDLEIVRASGDVVRLLQGVFTVSKEVTR